MWKTVKRRLLLTATVAALATLLLWPRPQAEAPTPDPPKRAQQGTPTVAPIPPPLDGPPHVELTMPQPPKEVGSICFSMPPSIAFSPPAPLEQGSPTDRLGSQLVSWTRRTSPPRPVRKQLEALGLTPVRFGLAVKDVSPWLALAALQAESQWSLSRSAERSWAFEERYGVKYYRREGEDLRASDPEARALARDPDRSLELQLADALRGDDLIGQRARLYSHDVLDDLQRNHELSERERVTAREQAVDEVFAILHASDDPELLQRAVEQLVAGSFETSEEDDARLLEVIEALPLPAGRAVALTRANQAWRANDREAVLRWWAVYEPLVDLCLATPPREWPPSCGCAFPNGEKSLTTLLDRGWVEPRSVRDHLIQASGQCVKAEIWPDAADVEPDSPFGRCIQEQLGPDIVLGRDVTLSYAFVPTYAR